MKKLFIILGSIFVFCTPTFSGQTQQNDLNSTYNEARPIEVMLLIDRLYDIDLSNSTYRMEAEIILDWKDPELVKKIKEKHQEVTFTGAKLKKILADAWHPEFIIANEVSPRTTDFQTLKIFDDGTLEVFEKFITKVAFDADIREYPFGDIDLTLDISAFTHEFNEMVLKPTFFEIGHGRENEQVIKGPWYLKDKYVTESRDHRLSSHSAVFSHNKFHFILQHDFMDSVQKIILPIAAVLIFSTFLNYFLSLQFKSNAEWRIGGQITLVLTILALKFSLTGQIPVTHYLNFVDELFLIAIMVVGLNLIMGIVIHNLYLRRPAGRASRIELGYKIIQPFLLITLLALAVYSTFLAGSPDKFNRCQKGNAACVNLPMPEKKVQL